VKILQKLSEGGATFFDSHYEIVVSVAVVVTKYSKEYLIWKLCDLLLATVYCSLF